MHRCRGSREAADVDRPEIHRRLARHDPFRERHAGAAGTGDSHRVEPGTDIEAAQLRRLAQNVVQVGREALRPVHERLDAGLFQRRHADQRVVHQDLELVPVVRQHAEFEIVRNDVLVPGLGLGLEAAHQQAAHFLLEVDIAVGIAHHRQVARHVLHLLRDDIHVLAGIERHRHADHAPELARPLATAIDDDLGLDRPSVVCTPVTRRPEGPSSVSTDVTRVFSKMRTPPLRAPLASAWVMSAGLALPSPGSQTAPPDRRCA